MSFDRLRRCGVGILGAMAVAAVLWGGEARAQRVSREIIPQATALRNGLTRAWVTHVELDRSRGRIAYVTVSDGLLMVQTDQATVQVMDAETRRTMWIAHVGRPDYPTTPPAANDRFVVTTNGATLYLFDRETGRLIWEKRLDGVPSAGVAISRLRAYVPLTSGSMRSYLLPDPDAESTVDPLEKLLKDQPLLYNGKGMAESAPVVTSTNIVWATSAGNVYSVNPLNMSAQFKFTARDAITAPLAYRTPFVYAASRDGFVYALREERGSTNWRFSTGNPVIEQPVAVGDALYVIPETGGLFRLSVETGAEQWSVPNIFEFLAASPTRLYMADGLGWLVILDARTGARLGAIDATLLDLKIINAENDRIYLGTSTGIIQCLHELALTESVVHKEAVEEPVEAAEPAEGADDEDEAPAEEMPLDEVEEEPADDMELEDNPFDAADEEAEAGMDEEETEEEAEAEEEMPAEEAEMPLDGEADDAGVDPDAEDPDAEDPDAEDADAEDTDPGDPDAEAEGA